MMTLGATRNYKFGQKNNWRRTVWNEVLRCAGGREKTDPILYLAGPSDLDRAIAISKGVPEQNLIAIDRCRRNVENVKRAGQPAIDAEALDVLRAWPRRRRVAAVLLDLCSGLERVLVAKGLPDIFSRDPFHDSVVMVNMMRGRDQSTNDARDRFPGFFEAFALALSTHPATYMSPLSNSPKNRAVQLLAYAVAAATCPAMRAFPNVPFEQMAFHLLNDMRPALNSYKSGSLTFDSVIYRPFSLLDHRECGFDYDHDDVDAALQPDERMARRISALLAVRTSRMRGHAR